jgi:hypothetical protein
MYFVLVTPFLSHAKLPKTKIKKRKALKIIYISLRSLGTI